MENKFFLHRIRKDGDTSLNKGIEVHDSLDAAIQSFHAQMKMAYNNPANPNTTFVSCMVTDQLDNAVTNYNETWDIGNGSEFFVHYIRHDGETYIKGIDVFDNYPDACRMFHTYMEYGYGNPKYPSVTFVSTKITGNSGLSFKSEVWVKPDE
jgi:hypothetical protein